MKWNSELYDNAQSFVSEYGKGLITFIPQRENLTILDLGCGTGDLTHAIATTYPCQIIGTDYSTEMIATAKAKYPHLNFSVCDACELPFTDTFDVIFSNAVFHWIPNQKALHQAIYNALKVDGLLICEFGGARNIQKLSDAFAKALTSLGDTYNTPFYFPTTESHIQVLEDAGFTIDTIYDYDRPTELPNGILGLRQWVCQFFSSDLCKYDATTQETILSSMESTLKDTLFDGQNWVADYRRLRVIAHK